ncbi:hypothetical protein [Microvirga sesbaniae]|uniref:hypothetical protein n=1 Tax=Microvirga sesbaniae TaxID=681392 RepID=UPI0021CA9559|nr:hypothetical protein [Microvirga sp. HBU67692]
MKRDDPIGREYYSPLKSAEFWSDAAFYIAGALSIAALLVDKATYPRVSDAIQSLFALSVLAIFVSGLAIRLYWSSRARDKRVADFLSNAFGVALIHKQSSGYYNNTQTRPSKRLGAALLENSFFSKTIARGMLPYERTKIALYAAAWILAMLNRATDLALLAAVAQVIFSEQVIARWVRLEWLRTRFEYVYASLYSLIQATSDFESKGYKARTIELLLAYETGKAQAGISLSSRLFRKLNPRLSKEWKDISLKLGL